MKKLFLSMTAVAAMLFTACEKESLSPTNEITSNNLEVANNINTIVIEDSDALLFDPNDISASKGKKISLDSLPQIIKDYLATNYAGATAKSAFQNKDGSYMIMLKDKDGKPVVLYFDKDGKFVKAVKPKDPKNNDPKIDSNIVKAIQGYINLNYKGATGVKINKEKDGSYSATFKTADGKIVTLIFDKDGKFVKVGSTKDTNTGGNNGIDPTQLAALKAALEAKYPGNVLKSVKKNDDGGFKVLIISKDGKIIELIYDKDLIFVSEKVIGQVPTVITLPDAASNYIKANYTNAKIIGKVTQDKDGNYVVTISSDKGIFTLYFDKDGKFIKEVKKK